MFCFYCVVWRCGTVCEHHPVFSGVFFFHDICVSRWSEFLQQQIVRVLWGTCLYNNHQTHTNERMLKTNNNTKHRTIWRGRKRTRSNQKQENIFAHHVDNLCHVILHTFVRYATSYSRRVSLFLSLSPYLPALVHMQYSYIRICSYSWSSVGFHHYHSSVQQNIKAKQGIGTKITTKPRDILRTVFPYSVDEHEQMSYYFI